MMVLPWQLTGLSPTARGEPAAATQGTENTAADPFGGELAMDLGLRRRTATELANLASEVLFNRPADYPTARRLVALSLQLDPENARALATQRDMDIGQSAAYQHVNSFVQRWMADVRAAADASAAADQQPDRRLAAYLYSALALVSPKENPQDANRADELAKQGYAVSWAFVGRRTVPALDARGSPVAAPTPQQPPASLPSIHRQAEINGLVVEESFDGRWHGRTLEIIATSTAGISSGNVGVRTIGQVGQEMTISLQEAIRTVRLRHADVNRAPIEISFDDKYSEKDGGSAGTAFSLVLLSMYGDFAINPKVAVTGDITVDGKVRAVGEVPAKVHGAALDQCELALIPAGNADDMNDAILLQGPSALWEI
jgi:hypothetical protein